MIAPDDGGDAVLRAFLPRTEDDDAVEALEAAFGAEDSRGRRLRCAEVTVDMSPLTKQPEQRFVDVSLAELLRGNDDEADEPAAVCDADDKGEARVAALVVRGGRCILARSLKSPKAWEGMRLPSAPAVATGRIAAASVFCSCGSPVCMRTTVYFGRYSRSSRSRMNITARTTCIRTPMSLAWSRRWCGHTCGLQPTAFLGEASAGPIFG